MRRAFLVGALVLCVQAGVARAGISFTNEFVADFQFSFPAGSPFNHTNVDTPYIPFEAVGALTITVDNSLNDPSKPTTVAITGFSGSLEGVSPNAFLPYSIDPNVSFVGGSLTNIVRDGSGNVTSADITGLSAYWEMLAPGIRLYGSAPLVFNGSISGLPLKTGDIIAGPDPFNVYLDLGNPNTDPLAAIGRNRTLTATTVPEPASLVMLALGVPAFLAVACVRRKRS